jgi:hypothetical protein
MTNFNSRSAITFPDRGITMAHDVFISYSLKDKPIADAACVALETKGIRCWVAPRDIVPGRDWGGSIIEAIKGSRAMVLIFSANANTSAQIKREVERAVNKGIPVIPFRIEDVAPSDTLEYFISTPHWLDAFAPPLEPHLAYLAEVARQIVGCPDVSLVEVAERESREKAEAETATLAEEQRKAAKLAKLKLADEKKATEAAKVARLDEERRKAEQETRFKEERRRAAEVAERESREKSEAETATLAEEQRKAAKLAKLKLADEKKATEAAKVARLDEERRKAEQEARFKEERRRAAEVAESTRAEEERAKTARIVEAQQQPDELRASTKTARITEPQAAEPAAAKLATVISQSDLDRRAAFLKLARKAFQGITNQHLWFSAAIPPEKASAATKVYAPHVSQDAIMLLYDNTGFGGARNGFLLTVDAIYWHYLWLNASFARQCRYADIRNITFKESSTTELLINGKSITLNMGPKDRIARAVVSLIRSWKTHPA